MRPQDIVILLKILCYGSRSWYSKDLAMDLYLSSAEVSNSLKRNANSGLLDTEKKQVRKQAFLINGIQYVFPQRASEMTRGIPTAHSHSLMKKEFETEQQYVWPDAKSEQRGFSVQPLYTGVIKAVKKDEKLYLMLALVDSLRLGKAREKRVAIAELEKLFNQ